MERKFDNLVLSREDVPFLEDLGNAFYSHRSFWSNGEGRILKLHLGYSIKGSCMRALDKADQALKSMNSRKSAHFSDRKNLETVIV